MEVLTYVIDIDAFIGENVIEFFKYESGVWGWNELIPASDYRLLCITHACDNYIFVF